MLRFRGSILIKDIFNEYCFDTSKNSISMFQNDPLLSVDYVFGNHKCRPFEIKIETMDSEISQANQRTKTAKLNSCEHEPSKPQIPTAWEKLIWTWASCTLRLRRLDKRILFRQIGHHKQAPGAFRACGTKSFPRGS